MLAALAAFAPCLAPPASADPASSTSTRLRDAGRLATTLREQVDALERQASLAAQDQAEASEQLGRVISEELSAQAALTDAQSDGAAQRGEASRRARALYISGGQAGMVASVLSSSRGELGDVLLGIRTVQTLVDDDARAIDSVGKSVDRAVTESSRLQELRVQRQGLEQAATQASQQLQSLLAQQRALLAEADADVLALADQQRREEEQAALARAAAQAAAQAAGGSLAGGAGGSTPAPGATGPAATPTAQAAIDAATTMLGRPYQWGAVGPATFDCSGLTSWAYRQVGISIPRTSRAQYAALPKVPLDQLAPGDLVFFASGSSPSSIHHVGIYVGGGRMLHAPRTGDVVKISALWQRELYGAARPTA